MTTPNIPGMGELPLDMTLGFISWYSISNPKVTHTDVAATMERLGMTVAKPKAPRKGDAFKRACRYSERKGVPIPGTNHHANFLIRHVAQSALEVERHLVLEEVDEENRKLGYDVCAELVFDRVNDQLKIRQKKLGPDKDALVGQVLIELAEEFEDAQTFLDPQKLRLIMRDQLAAMRSVNVRPYGSVYFFPARYADMGHALEEFAGSLGDGCSFHTLPLVNTAKQREMIRGAFTTAIHEEASQVAEELARAIDNGKKLSDREFGEYRARYARLMENVADYKLLVDDQLEQAELEMELVQTRVMGALDAMTEDTDG